MAGVQKQKPPFLQPDDWFPIVPSNTVNFIDDTTNNTKGYKIAGVFVGTGGGDVALVSSLGSVVTFKNIASGTFLPCIAIRVNAANTTCTDLVGYVSGTGIGA